MTDFAGHAFKHHSSQKLARVSLAHVQGFIENIRHFSKTAVAHSRNSQYRPIVIHNGTRMDIADASALLHSVQASSSGQGRQEAQSSSASQSYEPEWTLGPVAEDSALRFSEAKKGFEEALSVLLSSYPPPQPTLFSRQESHEDDEQTQGAGARNSQYGTHTEYHWNTQHDLYISI